MTRRFKGYCSIPDCEKPLRTRGLCQTHYWHLWKHGTPYGPTVRRQAEVCSVPNCREKRCNARDLCMAHYARWLRTGSTDPERPIRQYRRKELTSEREI
jgi:hypothetical protein